MNPEEESVIGTSGKMQKHAALRATIGHDIAENEPSKTLNRGPKKEVRDYIFSP